MSVSPTPTPPWGYPANPPFYQFMPINPRPMLQDLCASPTPPPSVLSRRQNPTQLTQPVPNDSCNKDVFVRLKWNETEYKGRLVSIDSYMNLQLSGAQEYVSQKFTGSLGEVLIRCKLVSPPYTTRPWRS